MTTSGIMDAFTLIDNVAGEELSASYWVEPPNLAIYMEEGEEGDTPFNGNLIIPALHAVEDRHVSNNPPERVTLTKTLPKTLYKPVDISNVDPTELTQIHILLHKNARINAGKFVDSYREVLGKLGVNSSPTNIRIKRVNHEQKESILGLLETRGKDYVHQDGMVYVLGEELDGELEKVSNLPRFPLKYRVRL